MSKKQEVKCVFGHHDWRWTLTETFLNVFIINGMCRQCCKRNAVDHRVHSLTDAFGVFTKLREEIK